MTNNTSPSPQIPSPSDSTVTGLEILSPGQQLQKARLARSVEVSVVSGELNIPDYKILALEKDQYDELASPTFVKGYLRAYCRYLEIDADQLIAEYETIENDQVNADKALGKRRTIKMQSVEKPFPEWSWAIIAGVILFVGIAAYLLWGNLLFNEQADGGTVAVDDTTAEKAKVDTPATDDPATVKPLPESSQAALSVDKKTSKKQEVESAISSQVAVGESDPTPAINAPNDRSGSEVEKQVEVQQSASGNGVQPAREVVTEPSASTAQFNNSDLNSSSDKLTLSFNDDCWVEITDATGDKVHQGIGSVSSPLTIVGDAPFSIMLGNVRAADVAFNGKSVELKPIPGRNTLRLVVGEEP